MEITNYGEKQIGTSQFVIIAPHAAGDDLKTGLIAKKLAQELNGFFIINKQFKKPTNQNAKPDMTEDFNELCWGHSYDKYLWKPRHPEMKQFFKDIKKYCDDARKYSLEQKAVAVYIHGMKSDKVAIDIGAGAKRMFGNGSILGSRIFRDDKNQGEITLKIKHIKQIKRVLSTFTKEQYNMNTTIGRWYSGWSKQSAIQFHKHEGRDDYAVQFEISEQLRLNKDKRDQIIQLLAQTLQNTF